MGGTTLHAGIVAQWFETSVTLLKICYYGRQWDLIWCNDTCKLLKLYETVSFLGLFVNGRYQV